MPNQRHGADAQFEEVAFFVECTVHELYVVLTTVGERREALRGSNFKLYYSLCYRPGGFI